MSNFRSKWARRIMAFVLSGAMVMSNMSASAAQLTERGAVEESAEVEETTKVTVEADDDADSGKGDAPQKEQNTSDKDNKTSEVKVEGLNLTVTPVDTNGDETSTNDDISAFKLSWNGATVKVDGTEAADGAYTVTYDVSVKYTDSNNTEQTVSLDDATGISGSEYPVPVSMLAIGTIEYTFTVKATATEASPENGQEALTGTATANATKSYTKKDPNEGTEKTLAAPKNLNVVKKTTDDTEKKDYVTFSWDVAVGTNLDDYKISYDVEVTWKDDQNADKTFTKTGVEAENENDTTVSLDIGKNASDNFTLTADTEYTFSVTAKAEKTGEDSVESAPAETKKTFTDETVNVGTPEVTVAKTSDNNIDVTWTAVTDATSYVVTLKKGDDEVATETITVAQGTQLKKTFSKSGGYEPGTYTVSVTAKKGDVSGTPATAEVTITANTPAESKTYELDAADPLATVESESQGADATRIINACGTENFFSIASKNENKAMVGNTKDIETDLGSGNNKFKISDTETKTLTKGLNTGGGPGNYVSGKTMYQTIGFTVPSGSVADVVVGVYATAKSGVALYDSDKKIVQNYAYEYLATTPAVAKFSNVGAGTYFIGNAKKDGWGNTIGGGNSILCYARVTLTPVTTVAWSSLSAPTISAVQTEGKNEIVVNLTDAKIGADTGFEKIAVTMYSDEACTEESLVGTFNAIGDDDNATSGKAKAVFALKASGTFYFKAEGIRSGETSKTSTTSGTFKYFLTTPVITSIDNAGEGKVDLKWGAVNQATGYDFKIYSDKTLETEVSESEYTIAENVEGGIVTYTVSGLEVGNLYYFIVAAVLHTEDEEGNVTSDEKSDYSDKVRIRVTQDKDPTKYHIDLTGGLKKNQNPPYGTPDLVTFEAGCDMPYSSISDGKVIGGVKYMGSVQGGTNDNPLDGDGKGAKGTIPVSGAYFKMNPKETVKVIFVVGAADTKSYHCIKVGKAEDGTDTVLDEKTDSKTPEGSLSFVLDKDYTYYFYLNGSKVKVYDIVYSLYVDNGKLDWNEVYEPVIKNVALSSDKSAFEVTVTADIGSEGGDSLTVEMYDENDNTSKTGISTTEASEHKIILSPSGSGSYSFKAILERNTTTDADGNETEYDPKETGVSELYPFILPLSAPVMSSITNLGDGAIEVEWVASKEATGYLVKVYSDKNCTTEVTDAAKELLADFEDDGYTVKTKSPTSVNITGLTAGSTYYIKVAATRNRFDESEQKVVTDVSKYCDAEEKKVTQEAQLKWSFAAYSSSTSITATTMKLITDENGEPILDAKGQKTASSVAKNGYKAYGSIEDGASASENGSVNVWSMGGAGKVVPATVDGLAFYYTAIDPTTTNFKLEATAHVSEWVLSNGQDGFGLMAADQVGENGNGDFLWTNSYQAVVSKIEYNWDGDEVTTDGTKPKIAMKIGVGATEKIGATAEDVKMISAGDITQPPNWSASQWPLDTTFAKYATPGLTQTCNIVGNSGAWGTYKDPDTKAETKMWIPSTVPSSGTDDDLEVDFKLTLEKNDTGYFLSYVMPNGKVETKKYYDTEALNHIDDKVYVGFFAARNANVTFKDITYTTSAKGSGTVEEQPTTYITLQKSIASASTTNTSDYDLIFTSNWSGDLVVRNSDNRVAGKTKVTGSLDTVKAVLKDGDNEKDTKAHVTLSGLEVGNNVFTLTFTPDKKMKNAPAHTALRSYDPVTLTLTVEYRKYGSANSIIYVAPNGKSTGTGTKEEPLDIFTVVKYAQPGQVIYLAGGRYSLYKTIKIEPGVNGTKDNMITMMADPSATERPVFDFNKAVTGMTMAGNYWYFKGFDVTRSLDAQKGIQVSGSYNVLDQINTYYNGNTGLQISRNSGSDTYQDWPSYNKILNCTSFLNADHGYEDADGFAAKLTIGSGNVFDGCIAAYNADDGWDLFAKIESGQIGAVTIQNCVAYKNGYVLKEGGKDEGELSLAGEQVGAGNGNGFKMGGDALPGGSEQDGYETVTYTDENGETVTDYVYTGHKLINSIAFANKSKGIDSNSCPNNKVRDSISINNGASNVALYTYSNVKNTYYETDNVISYRTKNMGTSDDISARGLQLSADKHETWNTSNYKNATTYLWNTKEKKAMNQLASGEAWTGKLEGSLLNYNYTQNVVFSGSDTPYDDPNHRLLDRTGDGKINIGAYLTVTGSDAGVDGEASKPNDDLTGGNKETDGTVSAGNITITDDTASGELAEELQAVQTDLNTNKSYGINVYYVEESYYTGTAVKPEIRVYLNGELFTDYKASYKNNVNAYVAGNDRYKNILDTKRPTLILTLKGSYQGTYEYYFDIKPIDITDSSLVSITGLSGTAAPRRFAPTLIYNGKKLSSGKDYEAELGTANAYTIDAAKGSSGNFTGKKTGTYRISASATDISKMKFKLAATNFNYTGQPITPAVTLPSGVNLNDLDIVYSNNTDVGKATVTISAKESASSSSGESNGTPESGASDESGSTPESGATNESGSTGNTGNSGNTAVSIVGSTTLTFTIKKTPLKLGDTVTVSGINESGYEYTAAAISPAKIKVEVKDANDKAIQLLGVKKGSKDVNEKENGLYKYAYTYEYKNNTEAGNASLVIKGIHNFTGAVNYKFKITPKAASAVTEIAVKDGRYAFTNTGLEVGYSDNVEYTPNGTTTNIIVKYNGNTVSKKNYSVAYKNNKVVTESATATIKWKGSLKGTANKDLTYKISPCDFTNNNITAKSVSDVFTNGKSSIKASDLEKSKVVLVNVDKKLTKNKDYTLRYVYGEDAAASDEETPENPESGATPSSDLTPEAANTPESGSTPESGAGGSTGTGGSGSSTGAASGTYDSSDKQAGRTMINIPETGLDVTVYAVPVGTNYKENNTGIAVAEFRVAYYNIAQVKFQLIDKTTNKAAKVYFVDDTETQKSNLGALNRLNNKTKDTNSSAPYYLVATHKNAEIDFSNYVNKGTDKQADYTYDYENTSETTAGTKKVTIYGTGKFGGTKVFKYTLIKKSYNLKSAIVDTRGLSVDITNNAEKDQAAIKKALEGKITLNGAALDTKYIEVIYDASRVRSGGSLKVTITGAKVGGGVQPYSGMKTISIKVGSVSGTSGGNEPSSEEQSSGVTDETTTQPTTTTESSTNPAA